jgi:hypothetical protein
MADVRPDLFRITTVGGSNPCYLAGTRIATPEGAVCVEDLAVGSLVLTASNESAPVRWLGHRGIDCSRYREPAVVWPVCIRAHAFADGSPSRDLWVSPGHSIFVDGMLIQAQTLLNGATIVQIPRDRVEYWHVELHRHDILLAEGLPAESYLDTGNRTAFVNGGDFLEAYPDFEPKHWSETCAPLVKNGPAVRQLKRRLLQRAAELGYEMTADADAHVIADGQRIEPLRFGDSRLCFVVPASRAVIELRCHCFVPSQMVPESDDDRSLGLCLGRLQLDGTDIALEDEEAFVRDCWHPIESDADGTRRWSRDRVTLPGGTRLIVIDLAVPSYRWREPERDLAVRLA